jgi:hypothetical protein
MCLEDPEVASRTPDIPGAGDPLAHMVVDDTSLVKIVRQEINDRSRLFQVRLLTGHMAIDPPWEPS